MKTGLTTEELEKIEPPFFIKSYAPRTPPHMYFNTKEIGIDEDGNIYVDPEFETSFYVVRGSSESVKEKTEANPFYYAIMPPREPWPKSQQWHLVADKEYIDKIKVFKDPKYFRLFIMRIFGDKE